LPFLINNSFQPAQYKEEFLGLTFNLAEIFIDNLTCHVAQLINLDRFAQKVLDTKADTLVAVAF
jgi:hypothetical protein